MTDAALEPCPHCGARPPAVHLHSSQPSPHIAGWRVICDVTRGGCGAAGPMRMLESTAVDGWNRRTPTLESVTVTSSAPVSVTLHYSSGDVSL